MLLFICHLLISHVAGISVTAKSVDGEAIPAVLESSSTDLGTHSDNGAVLRRRAASPDAPPQELLAWTEVQELIFLGEEGAVVPPQAESPVVKWQDQSQIVVDTVQIDNGLVRVTGPQADLANFPVEIVRSLRFGEIDAEQQKRWDELLAQPSAEDLLVARKPNGKLDFLTGIVQGIQEDRVQFRFEGKVAEVRLNKVAGIIFPAKAHPTPSVATLSSRNGSTWHVASWKLQGDELLAQGTNGIELRFPIREVRSLQLSPNAFVFLSDLEPRTIRWVPYFLAGEGFKTETLAIYFAPSIDLDFDHRPLQLLADHDGTLRTYAKGMALHSQTQLVYRLAGEFRRFTAEVGIDPQVRGLGHVTLKFLADDKVLMDQPVEASVAQKVELDLTGCQQLTILVDFGEGFDLGDRLHVVDARLLR